MLDLYNTKVVPLVRPAAIVDNTDFVSQEVDCLGFDLARVVFQLGATDIAMAALKLTESDTAGSGHADIVGTRFGTDADITGATSALPADDDDNLLFIVDLDLRKRKRFLKTVATAGNGSTGTFLSALVILSRSKEGLDSAAKIGAANVLRV